MTTAELPEADEAGAAVMNAMRNASAVGVLYSAAVARRLGISPSDLECLDFIAEAAPVTAGAVARTTGLTTGAVTGVIDRLTAAGLVERSRPEHDRRQVLVTTTPQFLERVLPLFEPMRRLQTEVVGAHSPAELGTVAVFLARSLSAARDALAELETQAEREVSQSGAPT